MNWETKNPTTVKLLGLGLAGILVIAGATVAPAAMATLSVIAGTILGAVGVQIKEKQ